MQICWQDLPQSEMDVQTLYTLLALRNRVFIVEQNCPYQDLDGQDLQGENRHILGWREGELVACARILAPEQGTAPVAIGRVVVSSQARGLNLGYRLMEQALMSCAQNWPQQDVYLSAQAHLQAFYQKLGFQAQGEIYLEDNIPHIDMLRIAGME
ncbi:GNAT family N-acetyltransferase [[Erwinia] mediterraneensis]|uniref:GNAT family N-acetyltransferase n=1 Tax=[Erwinia] mediterraneensis TaxID=2161819 RepID=UPI0010321F6B|nr:GNAT family N-acetyltransferase [[Erwinia] mediterraneensis]